MHRSKTPTNFKSFIIICRYLVQSWGFQYCCSSGKDAAFWVQVLQLFLLRVKINSIHFTKTPKKFSNSNPPFVGNNRDSPAFYLAQFCVRNVNLKRQAWNPDCDLQRSAQILIREVHKRIHLAFHFFAIDKNIVTSVRNLRGKKRERKKKR